MYLQHTSNIFPIVPENRILYCLLRRQFALKVKLIFLEKIGNRYVVFLSFFFQHT